MTDYRDHARMAAEASARFFPAEGVASDEFAHAWPASGAEGRIRCRPEDYQVEELCHVQPDGQGEHLWLWVEKSGLSTPQLVERLAAHVERPVRDFSYSGLKDRHAVTRQWISLQWPIKQPEPVWPAEHPDYRVLCAHRHGRKLRRSTHHANHFNILIRRATGVDPEALRARVAQIRRHGVPNYFGPQRFGKGGRNLELSRALFSGRRLSRGRRGFALSAARSLLFNAVLDIRVHCRTWATLLPGDVFMLAGSRSMFAHEDTEESEASLCRRILAGDMHPTGPMPGRIGSSSLCPSGQAAELEQAVLGHWQSLVQGLAQFGVEQDRRRLCLPVPDLTLTEEEDGLRLAFSLPSGAFATSVIREMACVRSGPSPASE